MIEHGEHEFDDEYQLLEHLISEALGVQVFSYNSVVTDEFIAVMEKCSEGAFNTDIAKDLALKESHVELIQYILCNNDHAEYGGSPRGCWLTGKGRALLTEVLRLREKFFDNGGEL